MTSLTDGHPARRRAGLADDVAAPVEAAVAALGAGQSQGVVAAPAAQRLAVIEAAARRVAVTADGAGRAETRVTLAERR